MSMNNSISLLINDIVASKEFLELKEAKKVIEQFPNYKKSIIQFEENQQKVYNQNLNQMNLQSIMQKINKEYEQLLTVPEIKRYFLAVDSVNSLIGNIMEEINKRLEKFI